MGRTYDALSRTRVKPTPVDEESIPPTAVIPLFQPEVPPAPPEILTELQGDQATADTALLDDLSRDRDDVPFVEVGGDKPVYGNTIAPTEIVNPAPLRIGAAKPIDSPKIAELPIWSVAFYPIPEVKSTNGKRIAEDLVAFHRPDDPASANYRGVLAGITSQQPGGQALLIFTTIGPEAQSAAAILNLAITCAREDKRRVLVIEANHEQPAIADRLGIVSQPGMRELLNRSIPMSVALHQTAQTNLFALPPGDSDVPVSNAAEARLPSIVQNLRKRFDYVLVNGPEWGSGGATEWASLGDSVYLVVRAEQWDSPEVEAAHEAIVKAGGKIRGYIAMTPPTAASKLSA